MTSPQSVEIIDFTTGVARDEQPSPVSIMPQPANDALTLVNVGSGIRTVQLFSPTGELLSEESGSGTRRTINVQHLAPGTYIVRVQDYLGRVFTHQAVILR